MTENPQKEKKPWFRRKWPWITAAGVLVAAGVATAGFLLPRGAEIPEGVLQEPVVFTRQDQLMALFPGEKDEKGLGYCQSNLFNIACSSDGGALVWIDSAAGGICRLGGNFSRRPVCLLPAPYRRFRAGIRRPHGAFVL